MDIRNKIFSEFRYIKKHPIKNLFYLFCLYIIYAVATNCGACLKEKDYDFMQKIQTHLKQEDDAIKVADINPGDWIDVCIMSAANSEDEYRHDVRLLAENPNEANVVNDNVFRMRDIYKDEALVFRYEKNALEIFRYGIRENLGLLNMEIYRFTAEPYCLTRNEAYFLLTKLYKFSTKEFPLSESRKIKLISEEELKYALSE